MLELLVQHPERIFCRFIRNVPSTPLDQPQREGSTREAHQPSRVGILLSFEFVKCGRIRLGCPNPKGSIVRRPSLPFHTDQHAGFRNQPGGDHLLDGCHAGLPRLQILLSVLTRVITSLVSSRSLLNDSRMVTRRGLEPVMVSVVDNLRDLLLLLPDTSCIPSVPVTRDLGSRLSDCVTDADTDSD